MLYGIKIEIEVGCYCSIVGKLQNDPKEGIGNPMLVGVIEEIKKALDTKLVKFIGNDIWYPEWRIVEFTFGGIWMLNPNFDLSRIKTDNERLYNKYFKGKK
jgi:hypothetical protein